MDATNNIATDLFYKIRSRFSGLKLGDETSQITINPEDARFFDFNYTEGENPIGHITVSLAEPNSMKVYFSTGITEGMDDGQKNNWYKFLKELRQFAKRRLLAFDTRDIAKDNLDRRDYAFLSQYASPKPTTPNSVTTPVGEGIMNESNMYGTRTQSFQKLEDTRLIIKHSKTVMDDTTPGARTRNISALFVENCEGERFKYPFIHLAGARAMQRHVANGGVPYDDIGSNIIKMSEEIAQLKSFKNYVVRNDLMNSDNNTVVERSTAQLEELKLQVARLGKQKHYEAFVENFQAIEQPEVPEEMMEQLKDQFTVKSFKEDITSVFPVLYRLMQEKNEVGYDDIVAMTTEEKEEDELPFEPDEKTTDKDEFGNTIKKKNVAKHLAKKGMKQAMGESDPFAKFEEWAMTLGEQSAIQSSDEEEKQNAIKELQELVGQEFPAGVDGTNAIQSLEGIIDDPKLEQEIKTMAKEDSNQDVRSLVKDWLEENASEVVEELDFGDYEETQPEVGADEVEPQEEDLDVDLDEATRREFLDMLAKAGIGAAAAGIGTGIGAMKAGTLAQRMGADDDESDIEIKPRPYPDPEFVEVLVKAVNEKGYDETLKIIKTTDMFKNDPRKFQDYKDALDKELGMSEELDSILNLAGVDEPVAEGMDPEEFKQKVADSGDAGYEMIVQALKNEHGAKVQSEMAKMYQDIERDGMEMDDVLEIMMDRIEADYGDDYTADQDDNDDFDFRQEYDDDPMDDMMDDVEIEGNEFAKKVQDLKSQGKPKGTKFKTSDGEEHTLESIAEFIMSCYDRDSGTFPKGPQGVSLMVGKKFGEDAELVARKMVERMAPAQEQGAEELEELARIQKLSGL